MEALFESYVIQMLFFASRKTPSIEVLPQKSKDFWRTDGNRPRRVRPDIILKCKNNNKLVILDTKWKLPKNNVPADSDLKQMFVYNKLFNAESSNLVYPEVTPINNRKGTFVGSEHGNCSMWFVPIIDPKENRLNKNLGEIIFSQTM
jgi:5-methylcytosine-specific restriction enzyme subunit McrC